MVAEATLGSLQSIQFCCEWGLTSPQSSRPDLGALLLFHSILFQTAKPLPCPESPGAMGALRNLSCCVTPNSPKLLLTKFHSPSLMFLGFNLHDFCRNADSSQFSFKGYYLQSSPSAVRTAQKLRSKLLEACR